MIEQFIDNLIEREGGYVNHALDKGGPTNMGITCKTLSLFRHEPCNAEDVENLKLEEARRIYYIEYWRGPGLHLISSSDVVDEMLFDAAVHHGPGTAARLVQHALNVKADGIIGPVTRATVKNITAQELAARFIAERLEFFTKFISKNPEQMVFALGWSRRIKEFIRMIPYA